MINSNDLRIGNRFIREEQGQRGMEYDNNFVLTERRMASLFTSDTYLALQDLFPIPLTPEILEKCGFKKNRSGEPCIEIYDIATHLELMEGKDNWHYPQFTQTPQGEEERTVFFNRIQHLHQLQNLYHSLTTQELKIESSITN